MNFHSHLHIYKSKVKRLNGIKSDYLTFEMYLLRLSLNLNCLSFFFPLMCLVLELPMKSIPLVVAVSFHRLYFFFLMFVLALPFFFKKK
jgi:hypothetical protein